MIRRHFIDSFSNQELRCCPSPCEIAQSICFPAPSGPDTLMYLQYYNLWVYFPSEMAINSIIPVYSRCNTVLSSCITPLDCSTTREIAALSPSKHRLATMTLSQWNLCHSTLPQHLHSEKLPLSPKNLCVHYSGFVLACYFSVWMIEFRMHLLIILCEWICLKSDPWSCHPPK